MTTLLEPLPRCLAQAWLAVDPDRGSRDEIEILLAGSADALADRFGGHLAFGTAGLRGQLGTGPMRLNRVLVRVVAAAVASAVLEADSVLGVQPHIAVGFDARHRSRDFAVDTARVFAAQGIRCTLFPDVVPTPVLAFAVKHLGLSAGVMVTASHNPRRDNGYKVYWRGGAQISSPVDETIARVMESMELLADHDLAPEDHRLIQPAEPELVDTYLEKVIDLLDPAVPRTARLVYTALHGVGAKTLLAAFDRSGYPAPLVVESQIVPDPDFPTAPFPNPEETGVLEPLLDLAAEQRTDLALANDPDADRLAVAVPNGPSWRLLTGDELGSLLADYLLRRSAPAQPPPAVPPTERLVVNTVVSSRLLAALAAGHSTSSSPVRYVETLTGFKWIMHARMQHPESNFVVGYEEALGYCIGDVVHDKDGISAALVVAEMASELAAKGRTMLDLLDDIHRRHGVHVTGQRAIAFEASDSVVPEMAASMSLLRHRPPRALAGERITEVVDLAAGSADLPPTDGVILRFDCGRVVVRPSGTEPKMKLYGEVVVANGEDLVEARHQARRRLVDVLDAAVLFAASPEAGMRPVDPPRPAENDERLVEQATSTGPSSAGLDQARGLRSAIRRSILTLPARAATVGHVRALCSQARRPDPADPTVGPVAAVLVVPAFAAVASELLSGTSIEVVDNRSALSAEPFLSTPGELSTAVTALARTESQLGGNAEPG